MRGGGNISSAVWARFVSCFLDNAIFVSFFLIVFNFLRPKDVESIKNKPVLTIFNSGGGKIITIFYTFAPTCESVEVVIEI